jgi:hypothetical protein
MDTLILIAVFQIKHWYADFVIQTYAQTVRKGIYRDLVGISHTLDHVAGTLLALVVACFFMSISVPMILCIGILDGILHYHIDWTKVRFGTKNMQTPLFWQQFGHDQLAHQASYLLYIYLILLK